jgi:hypothetical protein
VTHVFKAGRFVLVQSDSSTSDGMNDFYKKIDLIKEYQNQYNKFPIDKKDNKHTHLVNFIEQNNDLYFNKTLPQYKINALEKLDNWEWKKNLVKLANIKKTTKEKQSKKKDDLPIFEKIKRLKDKNFKVDDICIELNIKKSQYYTYTKKMFFEGFDVEAYKPRTPESEIQYRSMVIKKYIKENRFEELPQRLNLSKSSIRGHIKYYLNFNERKF